MNSSEFSSNEPGKLSPSNQELSGQKETDRRIDFIVTSRGSKYTFNEDGTTTRFKAVENRELPPQDAIVFVPDFSTFRKLNPSNIYGGETLGANEEEYDRNLLLKIRGDERLKFIFNAQNTELKTNEEISREKSLIFLACGTKEKMDFKIPVSRVPKIGYYPYDTRTYNHPQRGLLKEFHLGHKVTEIVYKK